MVVNEKRAMIRRIGIEREEINIYNIPCSFLNTLYTVLLNVHFVRFKMKRMVFDIGSNCNILPTCICFLLPITRGNEMRTRKKKWKHFYFEYRSVYMVDDGT